MTRLLLLLLLLIAFPVFGESPTQEINTVLMHSTFKIFGPKAGDSSKMSFGTVFLVGKPQRSRRGYSYNVLVTAGHVLDDIAGDNATIIFRKVNPDGSYSELAQNFPIRDKGKSLYTKHSSADVAVMYLATPLATPITLVPLNYLVTDDTLKEIEFHPGDEVFILGFPLFANLPGGFPILRTGRIASYPLVPMRKANKWYVDVFLYGGNSGGPVYFRYENRFHRNTTHIGSWVQGIAGLIIEQANSSMSEFADKPLNVGLIVPAEFIRETIEGLPDPPEEK
ncbi:MAG: trypsin-like peptidase domain-containing protein [Acidobacteria bacterium]|nr:trypsin-like peptidase domain-containing protein [Acidobacteriota bacterium]